MNHGPVCHCAGCRAWGGTFPPDRTGEHIASPQEIAGRFREVRKVLEVSEIMNLLSFLQRTERI